MKPTRKAAKVKAVKRYDPRRDLQRWFSLSYASWLTIPRVLMEAMPEEWQEKMAELLFEYDEEFPNQPDIGTRVQVTRGRKLVPMPDWLINYRHPDRDAIAALRRVTPLAPRRASRGRR